MPARLARSPLLRVAAGRRLLGAQALDVVSVGVGSVAVPWLVLDSGADASIAGLAFATATLPYVVFGIPAGLVGDRIAPARILGVGHTAQALLALLIPLAALDGRAPIPLVLAVSLAIGAIRAFTDAAAFSSIGGIAGPDRFTEAQATLTAAWSAGFLVGPALGGLLIHAIGAPDAILVMAAAFAAAGVLGAGLPRPPAHAGATRAPAEALRAGLRVIFHDPAVRTLTLAMATWNVAATGIYALAVPFLRSQLGLGAREVGLVFGVGAAMGLVSAPLVGALDKSSSVGRSLVGLLAAFGAAAIALAFARGLGTATAAYAVLELAGWTVVTLFIGARQRRAPADLQALVGMSGRVIGQATMTAGALLASGATRVASLHAVYLAMACATVAATLAWARPLLAAARVPSEAA